MDHREVTTKSANANNLITNGRISAFRIKQSNTNLSQLASTQAPITVNSSKYRINGVDFDENTLKLELLDNTAMLSDNTINAYLECLSNKDAFMISSIHTSTVIFEGKCASKKHWSSFKVACGPVFHDDPNPNLRHWSLLFINMTHREFVHLDSMSSSPTRQMKYQDRILKFFSTRAEYKDFKFTRVALSHPVQRDSVSCGVFVCMFAKILLSSYDYVVANGELDFKIDGFRQEMYTKILTHAKKI